MRTHIAYLVIEAAKSILREHASGRSVDPERLDWAIRIYMANTRETEREPELVMATEKAA